MDEAWRTELAELIAIPSVSADPAHREDVKRAGEWVCELIRRIGGAAELTPFGERELVLGDIPASNGAANAPTVLVYNHFDVQPPAPLELWESDPYELDIRGEWAYGRGVTDDKGQLWLVLKAAQRLVEAGALPVNLRIAFDGEEEIGGHTIADWVAQDERGADACVIFDGGMLRRDVPTIELATRGLVTFDLKVRTGARDLHSGMYGGVALNAIHVLMRCMDAVLAGPDGRLPEPLRAGISPPTTEELEAWSQLPPGAESLSEQGARPLDANAAEEFYIRTWAEPSTDVNGIVGGKPGIRNTTLSVAAAGELSIRLAPGQNVETIGAAAERLMQEAAPEGAELEVVWKGSNPGLVSADAPAVQLAVEAFEQGVGIRPLLTRVGGSIPLMPALTEKGIDTILTGFGLPESNIHSPNERFLVPYFAAGIDTAAALFAALGRL
ncbi:MAG TPA: M20/M25/M40 family metallo-hydrolase [Gaiellaceae bacterium]|nr:M20/M25/M40 family metallo-hydrolase [Gaiellaceae bacterium]